jgi:hypothetical protein
MSRTALKSRAASVTESTFISTVYLLELILQSAGRN